ncbi:MAG TPA: hypothetical protein DDW93_04485 [Firmicutes bacterium]|jgi:hypothetical protein|nr:hypothetical protein [Bacillota bacterium]HBK69505.1 hypothetical protein [Bacillota bacterium]HBT17157.1 hypothetical protein [Bacillota bacterium]
MSRFHRKHRHFQYALDLLPDTISPLNIGEELDELDKMWVKIFFAEKRICEKDPFWVSITDYVI